MMVEDLYEQLEAKMTASFQKNFELLNQPDLGSRHPTGLIDHMLALLLVDVMPNGLFLAMILRCLPEDMRGLLATRIFLPPGSYDDGDESYFDSRSLGAKEVALAVLSSSS
jgi:hypothetical protein